jgi:hypothetical protein
MVKQLEVEADLSLPLSAEVKNGGVMHPLPHTSSCCGAQIIKIFYIIHKTVMMNSARTVARHFS